MRTLFGLLFTILACAIPCRAANYLIETELMARTGNYAIERNPGASGGYFLHTPAQGSECRGTYKFPKPGKYNVFLRYFGYGNNSRKVSVSVDNRLVGTAGDERNGIFWSKVGTIDLAVGRHEVSGKSVGAHARPDTLLFSDDPAFVPGDKQTGAEAGTALGCLDAVRFSGDITLGAATVGAPFESRHCGEDVSFRFLPSCDGTPLASGTLLYRFQCDDGQDISGKIPLDGKEKVISIKLSKPGFAWCHATLGNDFGDIAVCSDGKGKLRNLTFVSASGADEKLIPQHEEPADFDAFWTEQKAELAKVPLKADLKEVPGRDPGKYHTYEVSVTCAGPRPVTGYLTIPKDAKKKSLPVVVSFHGYGLHRHTTIEPWPGRIRFDINAHGMPLGKPAEFYTEFFKPLRGYAMHDGADARKCYFHQMAFRVMRALEFARTIPEWNGRDLAVYGGSQGGMQSLWAASLDPHVTFCSVSVPWNCNLGGEKFGLIRPVGCDVEYFPDLRYYDSANHAKRIKCPVDIFRAGLRDTLCPPAAVSRMYYNLSCPKQITWFENNTHFAPEPGTRTFTYRSDDFPKEHWRTDVK
ncbi:MAG: acetylxylan esterase [Victivallaceae bacterium]|nr:acetylxylan esterase [Victivallaceae bacterium]